MIANDSNRGFSGGNNDGVAAGTGELVFLLNPDAVLERGGLREIAAAFRETPDMGILGAKLVAEDGVTILHCGGEVGYPAHCRLYGRGEKDEGQWNKAMEVEFVVGAALGMWRKDWEKLGGLDESFNPAYYEDTDLCWRCRKMGKKVYYWPVKLLHHENVSLEYQSISFLTIHHRNRLWYMAKNFPILILLFIVLPAEFAWMLSRNSKGFRRRMIPLYMEAGGRFLKSRLFGQRESHALHRPSRMSS